MGLYLDSCAWQEGKKQRRRIRLIPSSGASQEGKIQEAILPSWWQEGLGEVLRTGVRYGTVTMACCATRGKPCVVFARRIPSVSPDWKPVFSDSK